MATIIAERSDDGATKSFSFSEIQNGTLVAWATENVADADARALLIDQGGEAETPSVPSDEKPVIVSNGALVEDFSRAILDFDGTDDGYVYDIQSRAAITVACRADPQGSGRQTLIDADGLLVYTDGNGTVKARITDGTSTPIVTLDRHLGVMNVVAAVDESTLVLHVGGETASTSHSVDRTQSGKVGVGKEVGGANPLQGHLSDAFAWGRFFTPAERSDTFKRRLRRYGPLPEPWQEADLRNVRRGDVHQPSEFGGPDQLNKPAYLLDFPVVKIIPDKIQNNWSRPSAAWVRNENGLYEQVGGATPRLQYGENGDPEGLLVEGDARTNHVPHSSDVNMWDKDNVSVGAGVESILNGESAYPLTGTGGGVKSNAYQSAGTLSSSNKVFWGIFEQDTTTNGSDSFILRIREQDGFFGVASLEYSFSTDTVSVGEDNVIEGHRRVLSEQGPNGGTVVLIQARYDPTSPNDYSGSPRRVQIRPDTDDGNDTVIVHHVQLEEPPTSSPIITGSSTVTRSSDSYLLQDSEWRSPENETWIYEIIPRGFSTPKSGRPIWPNSGIEMVIGDTTPFDLRTFSGSIVTSIDNVLPAHERSVTALAHDDSGHTLAANGQIKSQSTPHRLRDETSPGILKGGLPVSIIRVAYFPTRLSDSALHSFTS